MHKLKGIEMSQETVLNVSDMHIRKSQGEHHESQNFTLHFLIQAMTFWFIFVGTKSAHQLSNQEATVST